MMLRLHSQTKKTLRGDFFPFSQVYKCTYKPVFLSAESRNLLGTLTCHKVCDKSLKVKNRGLSNCLRHWLVVGLLVCQTVCHTSDTLDSQANCHSI